MLSLVNPVVGGLPTTTLDGGRAVILRRGVAAAQRRTAAPRGTFGPARFPPAERMLPP